MTNLLLLPLTADDLRHLVSDAVGEALDRRKADEPPLQQPALPSPDDYLSRDEVRRMLRLSYPTLRNLELRGELVPVRIARRVLYRRADVEAALNGRRAS